MTSDLTPRQKSILDFIIAFQREHRIAPTVREIGDHFGLSGPAGIHRILNILKEKGYLLAEPGKKRSWRFSDHAAMSGIPLLGNIAAGAPIEAVAVDGDDLPLSPGLFGCKECFGLRVKGDSMIEAHIMDGDLAIIRPQPRVDSGTIAAVLVQDLLTETTLKIVRYTRAVLTLEPANPVYAPLVFKGPQRSRVRVLGKYVGLIRKIGV
ncbi:LexA repressor [Desulfosarcina cetonica]|uniref:transcriptional repressor LexA n=1 Tax=Desulfosarcina cetonica TaxID=90730 RepID=UPI0006CF9219|nr:transcriptional repressor LexA [Desulfosarcina cetonica]VTR64596.1 LexA repressor [Desulfosarcina cetonica]